MKTHIKNLTLKKLKTVKKSMHSIFLSRSFYLVKIPPGLPKVMIIIILNVWQIPLETCQVPYIFGRFLFSIVKPFHNGLLINPSVWHVTRAREFHSIAIYCHICNRGFVRIVFKQEWWSRHVPWGCVAKGTIHKLLLVMVSHRENQASSNRETTSFLHVYAINAKVEFKSNFSIQPYKYTLCLTTGWWSVVPFFSAQSRSSSKGQQ